MTPVNEYEELRQLLHAMEEQSLDAAQQARLDSLLLANADLRRYYLRYSNLCGALRFARAESQPMPGVPREVIAVAGNVAATTKPSGLSRAAGRGVISGLRKHPIASLLVSSIAASLAAVMAWNVLTSRTQSGSNLAGTNNAVAQANLPTDAPAIKSIRLQSGTASLAIDKVGTVVIEGPADFDLLTPMRARLGGRGRLRMRVTEKTGRGFVIETPSGEITDLGTEFGVDLSDENETGLVVFEGMVDLRVSDINGLTQPERLIEGEGVLFGQGGRLDRLNSIVTGGTATFQRTGPTLSGLAPAAVISNVCDSNRSSKSKKFYEIVTGGLREDALAYVDRPHQWNGMTEKGMPPYLLGADYVKAFNEDNLQKKLEVQVSITRPAKLYVFFDDRLHAPDWLKKDFRDTGDKIGLDAGPFSKRSRKRTLGTGPGNSVEDQFSVWEKVVLEPCTVTLGGNRSDWKSGPIPAMYGIAAMPVAPAALPSLPEQRVSSKVGAP